MSQFAIKVQRKLSKGWRKEAIHLGQLWDIVRNGNVIFTNKTFIVRHKIDSDDLEHDPISYTYLVRGDRVKFQLKNGDQLVGKDPASKYEGGALGERYTIVTMRLLHDNIAIRTDDFCQIYRPTMPAGDGTYSIETVFHNSPQLAFDPNALTWSFVDQPVTSPLVAGVYTGITFGRRHGYAPEPELPYTTTPTGWIISLGDLPGVTLEEGDLITDTENNWYRVDRPYHQTEGSVLYQLHCSRVRA